VQVQPEKFVAQKPLMPALTQAGGDYKLSLAAEVLRTGGWIRLQAQGTSMLPSLWPGDVLTIEATNPDVIVVGDIVLVAHENRFFVHRFVKKSSFQGNPHWITRGDAVPQDDPPAAPDEVLGKVVAIRRGSRVTIPSRRVSPPLRILAKMLCHWDRFRSLALRIHAALREPEPVRDVSVGET
jgi:hypothetical protein